MPSNICVQRSFLPPTTSNAILVSAQQHGQIWLCIFHSEVLSHWLTNPLCLYPWISSFFTLALSRFHLLQRCRFAAADLIIVSTEVSLMQMCGSELIVLLSHFEGPVKVRDELYFWGKVWLFREWTTTDLMLSHSPSLGWYLSVNPASPPQASILPPASGKAIWT